MKSKLLVLVAFVALLAACKDRDAEKKIAALEARLAEMEAKNGGTATNPVQAMEAEQKPEGPLATMSFEQTEQDLGVINEGDVKELTYKFKNTGNAPLIIQSAQGSCGCTVPEWSKEPVPVGGEGYIKAKFDSQGKPNLQNKTVTVTANTYPKQTVLKFKAMVTPKAGGTGPLSK